MRIASSRHNVRVQLMGRRLSETVRKGFLYGALNLLEFFRDMSYHVGGMKRLSKCGTLKTIHAPDKYELE